MVELNFWLCAILLLTAIIGPIIIFYILVMLCCQLQKNSALNSNFPIKEKTILDYLLNEWIKSCFKKLLEHFQKISL